jgi:hypothetical protein
VINPQRGALENDWLLAPEPLDMSFASEVTAWGEAVRQCTGATNGRLPVLHENVRG